MNTTYWTGWPTKDDPYVNGAFWHLTFQLVLNKLKSTMCSPPRLAINSRGDPSAIVFP